MEESPYILNVPQSLMKRVAEVEIPHDHKAFEALDKGLEVVVLDPNIYRSIDYAVALGNAWSATRQADTAYFMATDWHRHARKDKSPTEYHESFHDFLLRPKLLILGGLSFMKTKASRESLDDTLHRRVQAGRVNVIAGWNMPSGDFVFEEGQELATDSRSEFPLLHQRACLPDMVMQTGAKQ